ncbi:MAG: VWA domain-containing protein [bacterium]|nr:VWA domain-containing protein [bacterium]
MALRTVTERRILRRWHALGVVLALLGCLSASNTLADEGEIVHLWVEVQDARGRMPGDLTAADFEISEGGTPLEAAGLEAGALERRAAGEEPTRFVLYFDQVLSGPGTVRRATESLSQLARQLTELGDVEIVIADVEPELVLETRDPLVLTERLSWTTADNEGGRRILALREQTLREVLRPSPAAAPNEPSAAAALVAAEIVAAAIDEEIELLRERQEQLLTWVSTEQRDGPRVLLLVEDGFDLDPLAFYTRHLDEETLRAVLKEPVETLAFEGTVRQTARALAATGWTVLPVAIGAAGGPGAIESTLMEARGAEDDPAATAAGVTIRPGALFRRQRAEDSEPTIPRPEYLDPHAPLRLLAEASGGEVIASDQGLRDALARFADRLELTYRSALPVDAELRRIEVRTRRPGLVVRTRRWLTRGMPEAVAALKLRSLGAGAELDGGLEVTAVLRLDATPEEDGVDEGEEKQGVEEPGTAELEARLAELEARLDLEEFAEDPSELAAAAFRVTVAVATATGEQRIERELLPTQDLRQQEEWRYQTSVELPPDASEVAILVEELASGRWGGSRAAVVSGRWADAGDDLLPAPKVIAIERPEDELLRGRIKFATRVYDPRVNRVSFLLDEREVAVKGRQPFTARIDLGRTPRRQTLTVVAYGDADEELGRDSVVLNAGRGGFQVEIIRPAELRGTGSVETEAAVAVPIERRLDRVLFFWNNEAVATLYAPPFRQRIRIPAGKPMGYIRVVAMLDDGSVAEDVAFMNGPQSSERVDVNLVELYVVVTDKAGRPVRGLTREDFQIRENGDSQEISTFSDAGDLPLTLGMAIDSSASMFVKLPNVQQAAIHFLESTFSEQDRAFLVDFDSQPRLALATTAHLDRVVRSIESLEASGRTALWESIVYSLVQLQGVSGRKALIVFSDGADEDDEFPFRSCLSFARKMGVPIYLILMKKQPKESSGLSLLVRSLTSRVDRLVATTGGRVFYAKEYRRLDEVYEEIEQELRSQYLLTYYPQAAERGNAWRDVDVDVDVDGLRPRTLSGYWP